MALEPATPSADLRSLVMKGGVFLFARQVGSMCLSFIGILLVTRIIGPESYGSYATAAGIAQYLQSFAQTGVCVFLVRHARHVSKDDYNTASTFLLVISLLFTLAVELGADVISIWVHAAGVAPLLRTVSLFAPLQALTSIAGVRLDRDLNFRRVALLELTGQVSYYLVAIPAALSGLGAWSLVAGWVTQQVVSCVQVHVVTGHRFAFAWDYATITRMLKYSVPFSAATWLNQARSLANPLIVGHFLGAEGVAYAALTIRLMELLAVVKTITWRLSLAAFARIQAFPDKLRAAINEGMELQTLAIGPMLLGFSWIGGNVLLKITGDRWSPVLELYPYIAVAYLTSTQFNMQVSALQVIGKNFDVTIFTLCNMFLFIAGNFTFVMRWGLVGYGWAEVLALPSYLVLHWFVTSSIGPLRYRLSMIWWIGIVVGLFWKQLGVWAIAAPFLALAFPESINKLRGLLKFVRRSRA